FFAGEGYEQYEMSVHTMEMSFHATLPEGVVHPQDKDILIRFLEHLENNDVFEQAVLRLKKANGKYVWVRITGTSIFDQMGKLVRVIGTINEVDAEKRSALLQAETKEQLEQLVENLPIGVGIYELENKVLLRYENRQARALLGIEQGTELYSEKCREQVAQHYDRNRVLQLLQREKRVVRADCLHITRQDGTPLCLHTISTILPLGEDGALCYAALMEVTDTSLSAGVSLRETEKAE
ncbi:MAG: PAS domain-containing protein, partial [Pygmaiobacter sp.]